MLLLLVVFSGRLLIDHTGAVEKVYLMSGPIKAIDQGFKRVVIQVPSAEKTITVGNPHSQKAVLKIKGKYTKLSGRLGLFFNLNR